MDSEEHSKRRAQLLDMLAVSPPPKQARLGFAKATPEMIAERKAAEEKQLRLKREEKAKEETAKKDLAQAWGLEWPQNRKKPRTGPVPKQEKWTAGLYVWIDKIIVGEATIPPTPPPLICPWDWDHKTVPVHLHKLPGAVPESLMPAESAAEPQTEEKKTGGKKPKRSYHKYEPPIIEFFFQFQKFSNLSRLAAVDYVKNNYPSLFPAGFNESRVRVCVESPELGAHESHPEQ